MFVLSQIQTRVDSMTETEEQKVVTPGVYLCGVEEFMPGRNTYSEDDGIFSSVSGIVSYEGKVVSVKGKEAQPQNIEVIGGIVDLIESCAFVIPAIVIPGEMKRAIPESLSLPISRMSSGGYIRNIRDAVRAGDIIKARVIKAPRGYELEFADRAHGVVKGFCSRCRGSMFLNDSTLICSLCKQVEKRKISSEYGLTGLKGWK